MDYSFMKDESVFMNDHGNINLNDPLVFSFSYIYDKKNRISDLKTII